MSNNSVLFRYDFWGSFEQGAVHPTAAVEQLSSQQWRKKADLYPSFL